MPSAALHGVGDHPVTPPLRLDGAAVAVAHRDVPHLAGTRRVAKHDAADGCRRLLHGNALAQPIEVGFPGARIGIGLGRRHRVVNASVKRARFLINQP